MHANSADKTSFPTCTGIYSFRRMPVGLCYSGSSFQLIIDIVMRGLNFNIYLIFLDAVIVYIRIIYEHTQRLELVFDRLRWVNFKLKQSKRVLLRKRVHFLGHIISAESVKTDPSKIEAVKYWPVPQNISGVQEFL
jgi:hypothetical protein